MSEAPKGRWFRFSLRRLFLLVVVITIPLSWMGYQLNWIRERRAFLKGPGASTTLAWEPIPNAPGMLWLFGENGHDVILCRPEGTAEARRLFPEARFLGVAEPDLMPGVRRLVPTGV